MATTTTTTLTLTRRGRFLLLGLPLLAALGATFMLLLFWVGANNNQAQASQHVSGVAVEEVTVFAGDTLWDIAADNRPDQDIVETMLQISEINELGDGTLRPGQQIVIPVAPER